jgi:D-hydroxyproline dehydrogenase subunit alpha
MENMETEICVIGGGPAGMTAALEAAKTGSRVLLVDEQKKLGGQIFRQFPKEFKISKKHLDKKFLDKEYKNGRKSIKRLEAYHDNLKIYNDAFVWGIFPGKAVSLIRNNKNISLSCRKIILAEGVYERPFPFPGWTLPGVMAAGGAQNLLKTQRVLPGRRFLLSGTGPLQLVFANQLIRAGAEVVAVLEASSKIGLKHYTSFLKNLKMVKDGIHLLNSLRKAKVPFLRGHAVVKAHGKSEINGATYAKLDENWAPISGTEVDIAIDTLCIGFGFISSTRLSRLCECDHRYDNRLKCWIPEHDQNMETSVAGIFVAGDSAGVAGHFVAAEEGRIAGIRASQQLGNISRKRADRIVNQNKRQLAGLRAFANAINEISSMRLGLHSIITDDTIICRCEDLTAKEIIDNLSSPSFMDLNALKRVTRFGMGDCQGRMCEPVVSRMVGLEKNVSIENVGILRHRPPIKPIPCDVFIPE